MDKAISQDKSELNETASLLNMAKTEATEAGTQIQAYKTELEELKIRMESEAREAKEDERTDKMVTAQNKKKTTTILRDENGDVTGAESE